MFKARFVVFLALSVSFYAVAHAATVPASEEAITVANHEITTNSEDRTSAEAASEDPTVSAGNHTTKDVESEGLPTQGHDSTVPEKTTHTPVKTEDSEDHLRTVILIGIIAGAVIALGIIVAIIIVVIKKMSGRP
ncbi:podoplanin isoform X2 [Latimeria chalumnae]|uniref:podoplanin isoform X2 n=1 Tax=Latimeria chalumnae TaxID=7897 RepID=UPI0003C165FA|nr:PREDICTED: podoplanin isoform X2 [Latimeria chalumnae]|eukprot:XP_006005245.1 PREDICTED: podoplanin isoform X2 [Latimeria chalumnae]